MVLLAIELTQCPWFGLDSGFRIYLWIKLHANVVGASDPKKSELISYVGHDEVHFQV